MKKLLTVLIVLSFSFTASAAVVREINGIDYFLLDDWDTADGECALRGKEYASSFYSYNEVSKNVISMSANGGNVKVLPESNGPYPVIASLTCK